MSPNVQSVSTEEILSVLRELSSQNPASFKAAEEKLKEFGECLGTWDVVHQLACDASLPIDLKKQALIQFKNCALGRWKSRKLFTDAHRTNIRARCFEFLKEGDATLAETNAIVFAKLARHDYPNGWPSLASDLCQLAELQMQSQTGNESAAALNRTLRTMGSIVKELSGKKLLVGVKAMQQLVDQWFAPLMPCYFACWQHIYQAIAHQRVVHAVARTLHTLHLLYKILSRMSTWLWSRVNKPGYDQIGNLLLNFYQSFKQQWSTLTELRPLTLQSLSESAAFTLTKHTISISKTFRKWQRISSENFLQLPESSLFILAHWQIVIAASGSESLFSDSNPHELYPLKLVIVGMALFKESLSRWASSRHQSSPVLAKDFIHKAVITIVTRFLPLKSNDLTKWSEDPEEWAGDEEIVEEAWEFGLRPCSERVLMVLAKSYPEYSIPALQAAFASAQESGDVLLKEAVYCAMGCCSIQLKDHVNFNELLQGQFSQEVVAKDPIYRVLKRRIAWLIGRWVLTADDMKPSRLVWEILSGLLSGQVENTDPVVHLSVIVAVKQCADSLQFEPDYFMPFLDRIMQGLTTIAINAETVEAKQKVLSSMDVVVDRAGGKILPFAEGIIKIVPLLWSQAEESGDFLIKGCLLSSLTQLIKAATNSEPFIPFIVPLLQESFSSKNKSSLEGDALLLWLIALQNTSMIGLNLGQPDLMDLFPFAMQCLSENLDITGTVVHIIESYLLLNAQTIMAQYSEELLASFERAVSLVIHTNLKDLMRALNLVASLVPISSWAQPLLSSGLFVQIIKNITVDKINAVILIEHIFVLARICLSNASIFLELVTSAAAIQNTATDIMLNDLLDQWWLKFDNMAEPGHRKLTAMGAACMVATGQDEILKRLPSEIFNLWLDCFGEIREAENGDAESSVTLHWQTGEAALTAFLQGSEGTLEESRRREFFINDPVQTARLTAVVAERLKLAQANCGGPEIFKARYLDSADPLLMAQVEKELMS